MSSGYSELVATAVKALESSGCNHVVTLHSKPSHSDICAFCRDVSIQLGANIPVPKSVSPAGVGLYSLILTRP